MRLPSPFSHVALRRAFPFGVATARQLVAAGTTERTVYRRCLDGGPWTRLLPGVILLSNGTPTRDQQLRAALLLGGPDAMVTGLEACRRHGLRRGPRQRSSMPGDEVHILVPARRQVRSVGFVHVERTRRLPAAVTRGAVALAPLPRACIDATRRLSDPGDVTELLADAVQRGLCGPAALVRELESGSRRGTAVPRAVLRELDAGVRSAAEREAKALWARSGLPEARWNVHVYDACGQLLGIVDCWVEEVAMAWEVESTEWHLSPIDHTRTVERAAAFVAAGVIYTASKPSTIRADPEGVIAMLRATYAHAVARPRPALRAVPAARSAMPLSRHQAS
jgi:hypothetical protein